MRIVFKGETFGYNLSKLYFEAASEISKVIESENPELYQQIRDCHATPVISAVIDFGFQVNEGDEPQILATDEGEVLTFRFNVDDTDVELEGSNIKEPMFNDTDRAIVDLAEGLPEVAHTIDVTGVAEKYTAHVGGFDVIVYENGVVTYHKDGKLVQEATVQIDKLDDFIDEIKKLVGDN